jgi:hypothetical protein
VLIFLLFFPRYIPEHVIVKHGKNGPPHAVMSVKMAPDGALPNEEFMIDYPGVGPQSFLNLWYEKGAEGQERLRLAHQILQQQTSETALASKAINVREASEVTGFAVLAHFF